jgi:hypothetical protein
MSSTAIFDEKPEDGLGEGYMFAGKIQVLGDGGSVVGA